LWTPFSASARSVAGGLLGHWPAPAAPDHYALRLAATDRAHNRAAVIVPVEVGPRDIIDALAATPPLFSPHADGRADTTTIGYRLLGPGRATLEVLANGGGVVRTLEAAVPREAGSYVTTWDGRTDGGAAVADGDLTVRLRITDGAGAVLQQDATAVVVDRSP